MWVGRPGTGTGAPLRMPHTARQTGTAPRATQGWKKENPLTNEGRGCCACTTGRPSPWCFAPERILAQSRTLPKNSRLVGLSRLILPLAEKLAAPVSVSDISDTSHSGQSCETKPTVFSGIKLAALSVYLLAGRMFAASGPLPFVVVELGAIER